MPLPEDHVGSGEGPYETVVSDGIGLPWPPQVSQVTANADS